MKKLIYFLTMGLFVLLVQNASAQMPPMGSHGGPPGEPMCFDPARGEIPCSEMPGADPNMPPPGNSCASY